MITYSELQIKQEELEQIDLSIFKKSDMVYVRCCRDNAMSCLQDIFIEFEKKGNIDRDDRIEQLQKIYDIHKNALDSMMEISRQDIFNTVSD